MPATQTAGRWLQECLNDTVYCALEEQNSTSLLDKLSRLDALAHGSIVGHAWFNLRFFGLRDVYPYYNSRDQYWSLWKAGRQGATPDRFLGKFPSSAGMVRYLINNICAARAA